MDIYLSDKSTTDSESCVAVNTCKQNFLNAGLAFVANDTDCLCCTGVGARPVGLPDVGLVGDCGAEEGLYNTASDGLRVCHIANTVADANSASCGMFAGAVEVLFALGVGSAVGGGNGGCGLFNTAG